MITRRKLILVLGAGALACPFSSFAQPQVKVRRIGYLSAPTRESVEKGVQAFLRTLRELGWIEGQNLVIEYRWAEGKVEQLPELAAELVRLKLELIVAPAGSAALAAKNATSSIPIVMIFPNNPVEMGLVASLRRPGGNVTGTTSTPGPEFFGKRLQLLKEAIPRASRVALLSNPANQEPPGYVDAVEAAARSLQIRLQRVEARGPEEFERAFTAMARERADALLVGAASTFLVHRSRITELAAKGRLPAMYDFREFVEAGGLMAYAVSMSDFVVHAAHYVDKILKGANPGDLPVEQPTQFELVVNMRTAKTLGIKIPNSILVQATKVID